MTGAGRARPRPRAPGPPADPGRAASLAQGRASKPDVSSWVGASAGTGKTHVLTRRVLRLLLNGAAPARILCLTFTKAAAAEMTHRIAARLGRWALMDDKALREDLRQTIGRRPEKAETERARTLFATCLDAPGGMRIQTIHAFCQALLKRFPLEAGVPPHFRVIEEGDQRALLNGVRDRVLADAEPGRGPYSEELALLTPLGGPDDLTALLGEFLGARGRLRNLLRDEVAVSGAVRRLYDDAGFDTGASQAMLDAEACADAARAEGLDDYAGAFLKADGSPSPAWRRGKRPRRCPTCPTSWGRKPPGSPPSSTARRLWRSCSAARRWPGSARRSIRATRRRSGGAPFSISTT